MHGLNQLRRCRTIGQIANLKPDTVIYIATISTNQAVSSYYLVPSVKKSVDSMAPHETSRARQKNLDQ
jgi:hypothetical protein